jgi:hypothetical protein
MDGYSKSSDITQTRAMLLERLSVKYPYSVTDSEQYTTFFRTDIEAVEVNIQIDLYGTVGVVQAGYYDETTDRVVKDIQSEVDDIYLNYV